MDVQVELVKTKKDLRQFLNFPYRLYQNDPLWVPPLYADRKKVVDPQQGNFFKDGIAELFLARSQGKVVGTISLAEDFNRTRTMGIKECMLGFVDCIENYAVFEAMMAKAVQWAKAREMHSLYGPYNLDREDSRGILIEGRDRPPAIMCGHQPTYYQHFFEQYGFQKYSDDGLAYAIELNLNNDKVKRLLRLAEQVKKRHPEFSVRGANMADMDAEIDRIVYLQNRGLAHFEDHVPYTRTDIETMILPVLDLVDMELVIFAEVNGQAAGFFPGIPNFNEVLIHLNGLRKPWDYIKALRYKNLQPKCLAIKSVVVPPEYWDSGVAILMFAEMAKRAAAKGYTWADLSLTGDENKDTWPLAHHMDAKIYKRYRFYKKELN